jgi:hypothetical protein
MAVMLFRFFASLINLVIIGGRVTLLRKGGFMSRNFRLSLLAIFTLVVIPSAFGQLPSGTTRWRNQRGSTLVLNNPGSGALTGTFTTAVGCGAGVARPIAGTTNGYAVSFTANFGTCQSITAWSGMLYTSSPMQIQTLWYLTTAGPPQWNSIIAGSDTFTRQ